MTGIEFLVRHRGAGPSYAVAGGLYTIKAAGPDTGGAYALIEMLLPPGSGPPPHTHSRETESFYVLEGEITFWVDGAELTAGPGTFVQAPPDRAHSFRNRAEAPARVLLLAAPAGIETFFAEIGAPVDARTPSPAVPPDLETVRRVAAAYGIAIRT
jgi:quercetin dioxygenase-like cupin family protein